MLNAGGRHFEKNTIKPNENIIGNIFNYDNTKTFEFIHALPPMTNKYASMAIDFSNQSGITLFNHNEQILHILPVFNTKFKQNINDNNNVNIDNTMLKNQRQIWNINDTYEWKQCHCKPTESNINLSTLSLIIPS